MSRHGRCRLRLEPSRGGTVGCLSLAPQAPRGGQCRSVTPKDEVGSVGLGAGPKPGIAGGRIQEVWLRSPQQVTKGEGVPGPGCSVASPKAQSGGQRAAHPPPPLPRWAHCLAPSPEHRGVTLRRPGKHSPRLGAPQRSRLHGLATAAVTCPHVQVPSAFWGLRRKPGSAILKCRHSPPICSGRFIDVLGTGD